MDRKDSHLETCLNEDIDFSRFEGTGFADFRFDHDALPEINKSEIDLSIDLFGKHLSAPLVIGAMTGGTDRAGEINRRLALAAEKCGIGMALGSQRKMLEDPTRRTSFAVREVAPGLSLLFGNIGAVQLNYGVDVSKLRQLVEDTACDAFHFHLNPLQEAIQPEGNTDFRGLMEKLRAVIPELGVPVLIKEVGAGISEATAAKLRELPLSGVETAGSGGTSWAKIEGLRNSQNTPRATGETFARWGIPTAESIQICRAALPRLIVIGSGGIRDGLEAAKALALGADAVALSLPFLKPATESVDAVVEAIETVKEALRTAMFVTGTKNIAALKKQKLRSTRDWTGNH